MTSPPYLSRRALWLNRLSEEVAKGLSERIASDALAPGSLLPDREALMAEYVTSGGVIDRALEMLVEEGLIVRAPEGTFQVSGTPKRHELEFPAAGEATRADVISILELRIGVEAQAAALAAERRTEAQLSAIRQAQGAFDDAVEARTGAAQADFQFHLAIAEATGNEYLCDLTEYLGPLLIPRMRMQLHPSDGSRDSNLAAAQTEHRAIVEAIAASDPDEARRAMRRHLNRTLALIRGLETPESEAPTSGEQE